MPDGRLPDGRLPDRPLADGARTRDIAILLLEDSDIDAELLAAHLAGADLSFTLKRVISRRDFVAALDAGGIDIVLADYSLPDFDGLTALDIAREKAPELPFVFVSGVVGEEFATNALKRGAVDYVMKRNLSRLATTVERALDQARERDARRRTEEALRRSEVSARVATDAAQLGLWDYDPRSGRLGCDARCRRLFGLSADAEMSYALFLGGCHAEDRETLGAAIRQAAIWRPDHDGTFAHVCRTVGLDGRERWVATHGQAIFEHDVCTKLVGVTRDVTEERRAHEALSDLAAALERQVAERTAERDRIWRLSPDLFAVASFDGFMRRLNPAWSTMLGHDPEALVGTRFAALLHPDDEGAAQDIVRRLSQGWTVDQFETRLRHADESWRWVSWTAAPEGEAFYAVGRDITSTREAAAALADRNRALAAEIEERERVEDTLHQMQRLEAVGQLTSGVAHDFNNLLMVILGSVDFVDRALTKVPVETRVRERVGHIRTAAERGATLIAQLLAFSRRQKLEPKPVDLNETVGGMRELLQSSIGGSVGLEMALAPGLWPALVDPTQIELIVLNLAINARDAMDVGGTLGVATANVSLAVMPRRPEEPPPGDYVALSVSDTGTGMTPEVLAKAFEPFFTTKAVGKGSGLGLAQVYGFAKQSGGGVRIATRAGEGTTVSVYLPRAADAAVEAPPAVAPAPLAARGAGRTVLLVDDDGAVRMVTAAMLEDLGCTVVEAAGGPAALDMLQDGEDFDLLLVDYAMPGINGAEVAAAAAKLRPGLPVIFVTGYADLDALAHVGEDRMIRKPFRAEELARKIGAVPMRAEG